MFYSYQGEIILDVISWWKWSLDVTLPWAVTFHLSLYLFGMKHYFNNTFNHWFFNRENFHSSITMVCMSRGPAGILKINTWLFFKACIFIPLEIKIFLVTMVMVSIKKSYSFLYSLVNLYTQSCDLSFLSSFFPFFQYKYFWSLR